MPSIIDKVKKRNTAKGLPEGVDVVPINASFFRAGMYIDTEVYLKVSNTYVLFCKNLLMDETMIHKMRSRISQSDYDVYVASDKVEEIMEQSREFEEIEKWQQALGEDGITAEELRLEKKKEMDNYTSISEDTKFLLENIMDSADIQSEQFDAVVENISDSVYNSDLSIILECINNIRKREDYLYTHSTNVATMNGLIGKWLGMSAFDIDRLIRTGLVHDIGKLKISPAIMNKPAKLTTEEYEEVKKHSEYSYQILVDSGMTDQQILGGVLFHHERNNGTGYPEGLKGQQIPLFAKITAVSDVYDAMVSKRPYKESHSPLEILAEFSRSRYSDLDMHIIEAFLENIPKHFMGKRGLLSDGRVCRITYMNPNDFEFPIVLVDDKLMKTNKFLRCVAVNSFSLDDII